MTNEYIKTIFEEYTNGTKQLVTDEDFKELYNIIDEYAKQVFNLDDSEHVDMNKRMEYPLKWAKSLKNQGKEVIPNLNKDIINYIALCNVYIYKKHEIEEKA